jgi:4-coumarate--CoA ligase
MTDKKILFLDEIARQLTDSDAKILFGMASMSGVLTAAVEKSKRNIKIVYTTESSSESIPAGGIRFSDLVESKNVDLSALKDSDRDCFKTSMLPYSSGTTGLSKGVMLSHMNLVSNSLQISSPEMKVAHDAVGDHQDVIPCVLPFFHIYGLTVTMIAKLAQGCKLVTLPSFKPNTYLNALEKYKGNILHLVPPISEWIMFMTLVVRF